MYALYKKDKCPNQMKINYISYNEINSSCCIHYKWGTCRVVRDIPFSAHFINVQNSNF